MSVLLLIRFIEELQTEVREIEISFTAVVIGWRRTVQTNEQTIKASDNYFNKHRVPERKLFHIHNPTH